MINKKRLEDLELDNKKVLLRCDFNVPINKAGSITDDIRIKSVIPTMEYILKEGGTLILISHLGRPNGEANNEFSLEAVAKRISELLNKEVKFANDDLVVGESTKKLVSELNKGEILLLQNIRYRKEENKNDENFSKELASLADLYVNDAFGTTHRSHASTVGVAKYLPSAMGYLMEKELTIMGETLEKPEKPLVAIIGGAKVSDKIGVIENLLDKVDTLIIGGGMAFTFLKAKGYEIGKSLLEEDRVELAVSLMEKAKTKNVDLLLPIDIVVAKKFDNESEHWTVNSNSIPEEVMGLDIGENTIELFLENIKNAKTVIWNGPMGVFEMPSFALGTKAVAKALAENKGTTIIGGGDSAAAVRILGYADKITHISTGGGASLVLLEGKKLPGVEALQNK